MAQSRLEKIGTIFTRVSGLLRSGAMKPEDKPIWYDVYAAFPPKLEPRFDRPAPNVPIRNIFYEEDVVRAKYHKGLKFPESVNLGDSRRETQTQQFLQIYNGLKNQGALDQEQVFATAQEMLAEQRRTEAGDAFTVEVEADNTTSLSQDFSEAKEEKSKNLRAGTGPNTSGGSGINIQNLFKD